jgi:hypothetical protein
MENGCIADASRGSLRHGRHLLVTAIPIGSLVWNRAGGSGEEAVLGTDYVRIYSIMRHVGPQPKVNVALVLVD